MTAATSLSCMDYISFKFGCQSISRDFNDICNSGSPDWLYDYYNNSNRKIERWIDGSAHFDEEFTGHGNKSWDIFVEKAQRFGTPRGAFDNNNSNEFSLKDFLDTVNEESLRIFQHSNGKETSVIKENSDEAFIASRNEPKKTARRISTARIESNKTLREITNNKQFSLLKADTEESCSDSELELLQICKIQEQRDMLNLRTDSEPSREINRLSSRKRNFADNFCSSIKDDSPKRMRPCVNFYRMQNSRFTPNSCEDVNEKQFLPIEGHLK